LKINDDIIQLKFLLFEDNRDLNVFGKDYFIGLVF